MTSTRRFPSRAVQLHGFAEDLFSRFGSDTKPSDFDHIETDEAIAWLLAAPAGTCHSDACGALAHAADVAQGKDRARLNGLVLALLDPDTSLDRIVETRDALRAGMLDAVKFEIREALPEVLEALAHEASLRRGAPDPARDPMALAKAVTP